LADPFRDVTVVSPSSVNVSQPYNAFALMEISGDGSNIMVGFAPKGKCNTAKRILSVCCWKSLALSTEAVVHAYDISKDKTSRQQP
jgi:hypothetical protein